NVLWPLVSLHLRNLAVSNIEERLIGAGKCDFMIELPRAHLQTLRVPIELKTARKDYTEKDLIAPIENQLWDQYMKPHGCRHGIYVVLWFRSGDFPYPQKWSSIDVLRADIEKECKRVSAQHQVE